MNIFNCLLMFIFFVNPNFQYKHLLRYLFIFDEKCNFKDTESILCNLSRLCSILKASFVSFIEDLITDRMKFGLHDSL